MCLGFRLLSGKIFLAGVSFGVSAALTAKYLIDEQNRRKTELPD